MNLRITGLFFGLVFLFSGCALQKDNPTLGPYAKKSQAYVFPPERKNKPVRKHFIINRPNTVYLGQLGQK